MDPGSAAGLPTYSTAEVLGVRGGSTGLSAADSVLQEMLLFKRNDSGPVLWPGGQEVRLHSHSGLSRPWNL